MIVSLRFWQVDLQLNRLVNQFISEGATLLKCFAESGKTSKIEGKTKIISKNGCDGMCKDVDKQWNMEKNTVGHRERYTTWFLIKTT